jgi:hypothetical protein
MGSHRERRHSGVNARRAQPRTALAGLLVGELDGGARDLLAFTQLRAGTSGPRSASLNRIRLRPWSWCRRSRRARGQHTDRRQHSQQSGTSASRSRKLLRESPRDRAQRRSPRERILRIAAAGADPDARSRRLLADTAVRPAVGSSLASASGTTRSKCRPRSPSACGLGSPIRPDVDEKISVEDLQKGTTCSQRSDLVQRADWDPFKP